jgi:acylaminoacyl-peptidase
MPRRSKPSAEGGRRPPTPEDFARLRIATEPRLSPDGALVAFTVQTVAPSRDDYRHAIWLVPADGSAPPRQITLGAKHDRRPRFSPDGRQLAFLSDRRLIVDDDPKAGADPQPREDAVQVHVLPLDGGEARRVTDLPRGAEGFEWSPDGARLLVTSISVGATRDDDARRRGTPPPPASGDPPRSDVHYVDRLRYLENGVGFSYHRVPHVWIVDAETGNARRLTEERTAEANAAWSPDGHRIAYTADRRRDDDLADRSDIYVTDVEGGDTTRISGGEGIFAGLAWTSDGKSIVAIGGRNPDDVYRRDVWLFPADGSDAGPAGGGNLSSRHDIFPDATMASDAQPGEQPRLVPTADGRAVFLTAPRDGSIELWRLAWEDGALERLTEGRHYVSGWDASPGLDAGDRLAFIRSSPTELGDVHVLDPGRGGPKRLTTLNEDVLAELELRDAVERAVDVEGRRIQGWLIPAGLGRCPLVTEIHGGPHTLYGWAPVWEFQVLAAAGISVFYCNPRGSEGYGRDFNEANLRDWGAGPSRDVLAGLDALVADGVADPDRLGLTGGSYGGYLTNWILGHDRRFRAAMTCRSVADMSTLYLTGDISSADWARTEFGAAPWEDFEGFHEQSPLKYAENIRTPLLIQHSERDLRATVGQAEALFTILRSLRRPVRLMRVPEESHELTRSGTPFRRIENLRQVRDWFVHFLVDGRRSLPPLPKERAGK